MSTVLPVMSLTSPTVAMSLAKMTPVFELTPLLERLRTQKSKAEATAHRSLTEQFDGFLEVEEKVLSAAGLDQAATSTILEYLRQRRPAILKNLENGRIVYVGRYQNAIDVAQRDCSRMMRMPERAGKIKTKLLKRVKRKAVGLATIWADVISLAYGHDFGISSWWSTLAGATVSVIISDKANT